MLLPPLLHMPLTIRPFDCLVQTLSRSEFVASLIQVFSCTLFQFFSLSPWVTFCTIVCGRVAELIFEVGVLVLYFPLTEQVAQKVEQMKKTALQVIQNLENAVMTKKDFITPRGVTVVLFKRIPFKGVV